MINEQACDWCGIGAYRRICPICQKKFEQEEFQNGKLEALQEVEKCWVQSNNCPECKRRFFALSGGTLECSRGCSKNCKRIIVDYDKLQSLKESEKAGRPLDSRGLSPSNREKAERLSENSPEGTCDCVQSLIGYECLTCKKSFSEHGWNAHQEDTGHDNLKAIYEHTLECSINKEASAVKTDSEKDRLSEVGPYRDSRAMDRKDLKKSSEKSANEASCICGKKDCPCVDCEDCHWSKSKEVSHV